MTWPATPPGPPAPEGPRPPGIDRVSLVLLAVAALWGVGLVVAAAIVPTNSATAGSGGVSFAAPSTTMLQQNGPVVLAVVGAALLAVGLVAVAIKWRRASARRGAGPLGWGAVGALGVLTVLGLMSIGIFLMPVVLLLAIVCARQEAHRT